MGEVCDRESEDPLSGPGIVLLVVADRVGVSPVHRARILVVLLDVEAGGHVEDVLQRDLRPGGDRGQLRDEIRHRGIDVDHPLAHRDADEHRRERLGR